MRMRLGAFFLLAGILGVCLPVSAHHGNAAYSMTEVVLKNAVVKNFYWANPHCIIQFDVKDAKGNFTHWTAEAGSPEALTNQGWTKTSLQPSNVITVYIHQAKNGNPVGRISHVVLADGTTLTDSAGGGDVKGKGNRRGGAGARSQY
jgi:Family of unknown function (DUF6152)